MKFKTFVPEIHDRFCIDLIKSTLETEFTDVEINIETKVVKFSSDKDSEKVSFLLDGLFRKELNKHGYTYMQLSLDQD